MCKGSSLFFFGSFQDRPVRGRFATCQVRAKCALLHIAITMLRASCSAQTTAGNASPPTTLHCTVRPLHSPPTAHYTRIVCCALCTGALDLAARHCCCCCSCCQCPFDPPPLSALSKGRHAIHQGCDQGAQAYKHHKKSTRCGSKRTKTHCQHRQQLTSTPLSLQRYPKISVEAVADHQPLGTTSAQLLRRAYRC